MAEIRSDLCGSNSDITSTSLCAWVLNEASGNRRSPVLSPELAGALGIPAAAAGTGFISLAVGVTGNKLLSNRDSTVQQGEPTHCGVPGGASQWLAIHPKDSGILEIDTIGSDIDTVVALYAGETFLSLREVACAITAPRMVFAVASAFRWRAGSFIWSRSMEFRPPAAPSV